MLNTSCCPFPTCVDLMCRFDLIILYVGLYCFALHFAFICNIYYTEECLHKRIEQWNCWCSCIQPFYFSFFFSPVRILSSTQIMIWPTPCGRMCRCRFTCRSTSFTSSTLRRSCRERSPWWSREGPMCTGTRPPPILQWPSRMHSKKCYISHPYVSLSHFLGLLLFLVF